MIPYDFQALEPKWQTFWDEQKLFECPDHSDKPKYYCLMMFPYPSGEMHVGHGRNYIIGDVVCRYKIMQGFNVLSPMGWDSFGLPAENYAIKVGIHPEETTRTNIDRMRHQLKKWGAGYDWRREIATSHPGYYRWTQWIFLELYKRGLAYQKKAAVNWCGGICQTVLANEQVIEGACERCGAEVSKRDLKQWFFKTTAYAQRLLDGIDKLEGWPDSVRARQRDWIGRSEGAKVEFVVAETGDPLPCFTTRPDTLFGVTFMAVAVEHPIVEKLIAGTDRAEEVRAFVKKTRMQSNIERTKEGGAKEGVWTGCHVTNPVNGEQVQLWVANYALMDYGTGAVMAVPAHDQRDFSFAKQYHLPIKVVIQSEAGDLDAATMTEAFVEEGPMVNSTELFDGKLSHSQGIPEIIDWLTETKRGERTINFRLRDWLISRQRYWGCPIPVVTCAGDCGVVPVPKDQLPVRLPKGVEFKPTGESPLKAVAEFVATTCPQCGGKAERETDTIDTFIDSSWYYLRYVCPRDDAQVFDSELVNEWLPVDQYIGGIEHATGHLIYSRFITKVLYDAGILGFEEPFARLFTQGMICMLSYRCPEHSWVHRNDVVEVDGQSTHKDCGAALVVEMNKMSKTKLNVVPASEIGDEWGVDTQRLYTLAVGPPAQDAEWQDAGVKGYSKFLRRVWTTTHDAGALIRGVEPRTETEGLDGEARELWRKCHRMIKRVTHDMEGGFHFNTAVAGIIELEHAIQIPKGEPNATELAVLGHAIDTMLRLLAPFAPHICEELWRAIGHEASIFDSAWPSFEEAALTQAEVKIVVQINGKVRIRDLLVPANSEEDVVRELTLAQDKVKEAAEGKQLRFFKYVPNRLVNVVFK